MRQNNRRVNNKQDKNVSEPLVINLPTPKVIREIPASQVTISKIEIEMFYDSPVEKIVEAYDKRIGKIVLWEGAAYDFIGEWTTADVEKRLKEIYK
jgi:hypothetical protein